MARTGSTSHCRNEAPPRRRGALLSRSSGATAGSCRNEAPPRRRGARPGPRRPRLPLRAAMRPRLEGGEHAPLACRPGGGSPRRNEAPPRRRGARTCRDRGRARPDGRNEAPPRRRGARPRPSPCRSCASGRNEAPPRRRGALGHVLAQEGDHRAAMRPRLEGGEHSPSPASPSVSRRGRNEAPPRRRGAPGDVPVRSLRATAPQ